MALPPKIAALGISQGDWQCTPLSVRAALLTGLAVAEKTALLEAENAALRASVAALQKQVAALEEKVNKDSSNSSKPPSTDPPGKKGKRQKKQKGKRRPGGQPGHRGHRRELLPVDEVDHLLVHQPKQCERCGHGLQEDNLSEPRRHQVTEIPLVEPVVTEHQERDGTCPCCGHLTKAVMPPEVPRGAFGPRLQALVAICSGAYHLSRRTVQALMKDLFGVQMALGSVVNCEQAVSADLEAPVAEAKEYVQQQAVVHADETGWRQGNRRAWLWVAVSSAATVFMVHARRGAMAARELLGSFRGVLVSDRWSAYSGWQTDRRQLCWAHLLRDFAAIAERGGESERIGEALLAKAHAMFHWWHRVRDGTMKRSTFRQLMSILRHEVEALLAEGEVCGHAKTEGTCHAILKLKEALWTFVRVEDVEPTNNDAERAVRSAVLWRKNSFGCHSDKGSRFVERMLTVTATLKQQDRNLVEYMVQAREASLCNQPVPSLLPVHKKAASLAA